MSAQPLVYSTPVFQVLDYVPVLDDYREDHWLQSVTLWSVSVGIRGSQLPKNRTMPTENVHSLTHERGFNEGYQLSLYWLPCSLPALQQHSKQIKRLMRKVKDFFISGSAINTTALWTPYLASQWTTTAPKRGIIGDIQIAPRVSEMVSVMVGFAAASLVKAICLSGDTISQQIHDMDTDV